MMGQWALYHDGWLLSTKVNRAPWDAFSPANPDPLNNQVFQLYDLSKSWNQSEDIAAQHPDKVKEMRKMFVEEAKKYQVFPLDASVGARVAAPRPSLTAGLQRVGLHAADDRRSAGRCAVPARHLLHPHGGHHRAGRRRRGHDRDLRRAFRGLGLLPAQGQAGVSAGTCSISSGSSGKPRRRSRPAGTSLEFDFKYDGLGVGTMAYNNFSGIGKGGTGTLKVDGKVVATKRMEKTIPIILQWDESFDIGSDTITGVNDADYLPPFPLTAKFNKLTIKIDRPQLSPEDIKKLEEGMKKAAARPRISAVTFVNHAGRLQRERPTYRRIGCS